MALFWEREHKRPYVAMCQSDPMLVPPASGQAGDSVQQMRWLTCIREAPRRCYALLS